MYCTTVKFTIKMNLFYYFLSKREEISVACIMYVPYDCLQRSQPTKIPLLPLPSTVVVLLLTHNVVDLVKSVACE